MRNISEYTHLFNKKKVFIPAIANGPDTITEHTTLASMGATGQAILENSKYFPVVKLAASGEEHHVKWRVPDDCNPDEPINVWAIWASNGPTSTTVTVGYDLSYNAFKIIDYASRAKADPETVPDSTTKLDTDLDEIVTLNTVAGGALTKYAPYRSMRGIINGSKLQINDFVNFKFELDQAPTGSGVIGFIGLEIEYAIRIRDFIVENYDF